MSTKFYCYNDIKNANISATTENAQFPLENLLEPMRSKVYRSTSNNDSVFFDFGYLAKIDTVMMVDDPMTGNKLLTCKVYLDNDPAFGSAIVQDLEIDAINGFSFTNFESIPLMRYMKLEMTSSAGFCEIAKLFAGAYVNLGEDVDFTLPFSFAYINNSVTSMNKFGQRFVDEINTYKKIEGSLKTLSRDELDGVLEIVKYSSNTRPLWVQFDGVLNNPNELSGYYYLSSNQQQPTLDNTLYWSMPLSLTEAL